MISRDVQRAESETFDVIVVGGGVYGAALALESVIRGWRPLLVERGDFGGETTAKSLRILHGGLRYLQHGDLARFRDSVRQRKWWLATLPELVRPIPFLMPLYGRGVEYPGLFRWALWANDLLSSGQNEGLPPEKRIPRGRILSREETLRLFPGARGDDLRGGALWHDASLDSTARVIMQMIRWTTERGGLALNYTEATGLLGPSGSIEGVAARDRITGSRLELRAPLVLNTAAASIPLLSGPDSIEPHSDFHPTLAFNLLLARRLPTQVPVVVRSRARRGHRYVLRPRGERTLAGTGHAAWTSPHPPTRVPDHLVAQFLSDVRSAVPEFDVSMDDVVCHLGGLQPARDQASHRVATRPTVVDHAKRGGPKGLMSIAGVKLTTAPGVARKVLSRCAPECSDAARDDFFDGLSRPSAWLPKSEFDALARRSSSDAAAIVRKLVAEESPLSMEDLLLRRLDWGLDVTDRNAAAQSLRSFLGREADNLPLSTSTLLARADGRQPRTARSPS